jgi:hypothetical protein
MITELQQNSILSKISQCFHDCFLESEQTQLRGGALEPFYQAKNSCESLHTIFFRGTIESSALHEISHWCIAGKQRRTLDDYGYWYSPDGRTHEEQVAFYKVEIKPQALEWIFSDACYLNFTISTDNLLGDVADTRLFIEKVTDQKNKYLTQGLPRRAQLFLKSLKQEF